MSSLIYLDNHATTPTDPRVAEVALHYMLEAFGNPNSVDHVFGDRARRAVETAKGLVAELVGATDARVVFTSGATEALNIAIQGLAYLFKDRGAAPVRILVSATEHSAVLHTCEVLATRGLAAVEIVPVDRLGRIDLEDLADRCRNGVDLVSVMAANNEVGTVYPIAEIANVAHAHGALFLTDATQLAGRGDIRFSDWGLDMLAISGHKMYGPKGCGALVLAPGVRLGPTVLGGSHQGGYRAGTINVPGVAALGEACRLRIRESTSDTLRIRKQRDRLESMLLGALPALSVNGDPSNRLPGNLHVSVPGLPNQAVIARLRDRVAVSTGSACSSGIEAPSHVLRAMHLDEQHLAGALRIGVGKFNTDNEIDEAVVLLVDAVEAVASALRSY